MEGEKIDRCPAEPKNNAHFNQKGKDLRPYLLVPLFFIFIRCGDKKDEYKITPDLIQNIKKANFSIMQSMKFISSVSEFLSILWRTAKEGNGCVVREGESRFIFSGCIINNITINGNIEKSEGIVDLRMQMDVSAETFAGNISGNILFRGTGTEIKDLELKIRTSQMNPQVRWIFQIKNILFLFLNQQDFITRAEKGLIRIIWTDDVGFEFTNFQYLQSVPEGTSDVSISFRGSVKSLKSNTCAKGINTYLEAELIGAPESMGLTETICPKSGGIKIGTKEENKISFSEEECKSLEMCRIFDLSL